MDESGHCATPWLGGTVQTDGKGIQNTRLGSINDLGRDIFIFQIESKARQAPGWVHLPHTPFRGRWLKQVPLPNRRIARSGNSPTTLGDFSMQEDGEKMVARKVMEHGRRIGLLLHP